MIVVVENRGEGWSSRVRAAKLMCESANVRHVENLSRPPVVLLIANQKKGTSSHQNAHV